jgi:hypothetical protein
MQLKVERKGSKVMRGIEGIAYLSGMDGVVVQFSTDTEDIVGVRWGLFHRYVWGGVREVFWWQGWEAFFV